MRHRRTTGPSAQPRAEQRSRLQRGGPFELPPWAADSANDNAQTSDSNLPNVQGDWEDDATTLYRRSEVSVRSLPRTHPRSIPPLPALPPRRSQVALERISSLPGEPSFALEGSLPRSIHPELRPRPSRWRALPGLLLLGACAYFSGRAMLWTAPLPYGRMPAPLTGISPEAHMRGTASAPLRAATVTPIVADSMHAAVGAALVDQASYTVVAAATSEAVEPSAKRLPRTAAERKQSSAHAPHAAHAAVARRIEPLRDPVEPDEEEIAPMADEGVLQVNSRPWSRVLLDGRFVGHTPQLGLHVSPGKHHILLVNEQMDMSKAFDVTVRAGQTVSRVELLDDDVSSSN